MLRLSLFLFCLSVSSSCRLLRWRLPHVARGGQGEGDLVVKVTCEHPAAPRYQSGTDPPIMIHHCLMESITLV